MIGDVEQELGGVGVRGNGVGGVVREKSGRLLDGSIEGEGDGEIRMRDGASGSGHEYPAGGVSRAVGNFMIEHQPKRAVTLLEQLLAQVLCTVIARRRIFCQ